MSDNSNLIEESSAQRAALFQALVLFGALALSLTLVMVSSSRHFRVETLTNARELNILGRGAIKDLIWSPDDNSFAVVTSIGVWLYNANNLTESPRLLDGHHNLVKGAVFDWSGTRLTSVDSETVNLWDVTTGIQLFVSRYGDDDLLGNNGVSTYRLINLAVFSPDGSILAFTTGDAQRIFLWNVNAQTPIGVLAPNTPIVQNLSFSPDGKTLAIIDRDGLLRLWNLETNTEQTVLQFEDVQFEGSLSFSPDGQTIVLAARSPNIVLLDIPTGEWRTIPGHGDTSCPGIGLGELRFSPDGTILASASCAFVRLWDLVSGTQIAVMQSNRRVGSIAFSPDGTRLAFGDYDAVQVWDVASGVRLSTLDGFSRPMSALEFSEDGTILSTRETDIVRLWDVETGEQQQVIDSQISAFDPDGVATLASELDTLHEISVGFWFALSPDGRTVAVSGRRTGENEDHVWLWDIATRSNYAVLDGYKMIFSPDSTRIATIGSGSSHPILALWDAASGASLYALPIEANTVVFNQDGSLLACYVNNALILLDAETGTVLTRLEGFDAAITSLAFNPRGDILVFGDADGKIGLWNLRNRGRLLELFAHKGAIWSLVFNSDSTLLASSGEDSTVRLWGIPASAEGSD